MGESSCSSNLSNIEKLLIIIQSVALKYNVIFLLHYHIYNKIIVRKYTAALTKL